MLPENAYKISHMMEEENYCKEEFSIYHISKLLKEKKETDSTAEIRGKYGLKTGDNR